MVSVFEGWGYDEIVPPLFDDVATFDPSFSSRLYSFTGREGTTLALRPDFTSLVAKIAAGRLRQAKMPLRLYYSGEVVRYEPPRPGRQSEFHQMGLEFLGGGGPVADVEVIAIAIECLEAAGVTDFVVTLGHAQVVSALLDEVGLESEDAARAAAVEALNRRDPLAVAQALPAGLGPSLSRQGLIGLAEDNGIRQSLHEVRAVLGVSERVVRALNELESVISAMEGAGLRGRIALDLSESRSLDYYTGLVFRIYASGLGFEVGGGGRYDTLLGRLGRPMPAIGFMLGLDRLALLVERLGASKSDAGPSAAPVTGTTLEETVREARTRRARGEKIRFEGPA